MKENIVWDEKFEPLVEIGSGGFSRVLKVIYKPDGKIYALKIMNFEITDQTKEVELQDFYSEVEFLKKLRHNSIVRIIDDFLIDNKPAILMEFVEGKSLDQLIEEKKYLSSDEVIEIASQISAGLMACHNNVEANQADSNSETSIHGLAIIHNDIHSKNIIKTQNENNAAQYKLFDFGLSFVDPEKADINLKQNGMKEYKAPEKWKEEKVGTPSDIYSLGVVLYQMLAGQVPFPVDNYDDLSQEIKLKQSVLHSNIPDIWPVRRRTIERRDYVSPDEPDFPCWLNNVIMKCLEKDPNKRYSSGKDLNEEIHRGMEGLLHAEWGETSFSEMQEPEPQFIPEPEPFVAGTINASTQVQRKPDETNKQKEQFIKHKKKLRRIRNLILFFSFAGILIAGLLIYKLIDKTKNLSDKQFIEAYYQADEAAVDAQGVDKLMEYFDFPVYYYNAMYSNQEFKDLYLNKLNSKKKEITLTKIVLDEGKNPIVIHAYGELKNYKRSSNTKPNYVGKIADEITLSNGKIKRIVKE